MEPSERIRVPELGRIEAELAELWRSASDEEAVVTRACTRNLVVVCDDGPRALTEACELVAGVSVATPGRALVVAPASADVGDRPVIDAWVSAHCHRVGNDGTQVCSEQITIETLPAGLELIPGTILQLLVEEMPVHVVWSRPRLFGDPLVDPLMALADQFIVDGSIAPDPPRFLGELRRLADRGDSAGHVADVAWARLDPWREAIASFFDAPFHRPALARIDSVQISAGRAASGEGPAIAAAYIAGWLGSRLGWDNAGDGGPWRRSDGRPVRVELLVAPDADEGRLASVRLEASNDGAPARFSAELHEDRSVRLRAEQPGVTPTDRRVVLPSRGVTAVVCGMLQQCEREAVFESALATAMRMVRV